LGIPAKPRSAGPSREHEEPPVESPLLPAMLSAGRGMQPQTRHCTATPSEARRFSHLYEKGISEVMEPNRQILGWTSKLVLGGVEPPLKQMSKCQREMNASDGGDPKRHCQLTSEDFKELGVRIVISDCGIYIVKH
jgi:hypothetical protein